MLYDLDVKMGNLIPVDNQGKKWNEAKEYQSVKVEDETGYNERYLLFTNNEISRFSKVIASLDSFIFNKIKTGSLSSMVNDMKFGRFYLCDVKSVTGNWVKAYLVKVRIRNKQDGEFDTTVFRIPYSVIKRAEKRSKRNPEDLAVTSWFADLLD